MIAQMTPGERLRAAVWMSYRICARSRMNLVFPSEWLPQTGLSCRADNGRLMAVATLYLDRTAPIAVCGFCIADPANTPRESADATRTLLEAMPGFARQRGAKWLLTTFGNRRINRMLDRIGFSTGEKAENKFLNLQ